MPNSQGWGAHVGCDLMVWTPCRPQSCYHSPVGQPHLSSPAPASEVAILHPGSALPAWS